MFAFCECCSSDFMRKNFDCTVEETEKGVRIEFVPKDPEKVKFFKEMLKNCKEFCGTECGC